MILINDENTDRIYFQYTVNYILQISVKIERTLWLTVIILDIMIHYTEVLFDSQIRILQSYKANSTGQLIIFLLLKDISYVT